MTSHEDLAETAILWRVAPDYAVLQHVWEDGGVLYHAGTGDTHLVDISTVAVLDLLREGPATVHALARRLAYDADIDDNPGLIERLAHILRELQRLRIAETATRS